MRAQPDARNPIEIDGTLVARALQLEAEQFRALMDREQISVLCERGTGEELGQTRVTFYHAGRRARFLYNGRWTQLDLQ